MEDLEPLLSNLLGCSLNHWDQAAKMTNPHSCARVPKQQRAMSGLKWNAEWSEWCENSERIRW